ncbi:hypothetical protein WMY93_034073, partial [Mugilogobius chulae]
MQKTEEEELLSRLQLLKRYKNKLTYAEFLQLCQTKEHDENICEADLSSVYLHKLLMLDYRARYIQAQQENTREQIETDDFFDTEEDYKSKSEQTQIHPLDLQMAVFHCSDSFLQQKMVTKLSQCQYALPLLVPDPFSEDILCPLWTFRQIQKTWKKTKDNLNVVTKSMPICKAETPMVFCFLHQHLINDRHPTFFHKNCPGSTENRLLFEGVAEIAWYCPSGKPNDFKDCVAFCNLHGDGLTHHKQLNILMEMSSINVVFVPKMDRDHDSAKVIKSLIESPKPLIVLIENNSDCVVQLKNKKYKYKVGLKNRGQFDVSEELKQIIKDILSAAPHNFFQLESMIKSELKVDEMNASCSKGLSFAEEIMITIKINKDLYRLTGQNIENEKSRKLVHQRESISSNGLRSFWTPMLQTVCHHCCKTIMKNGLKFWIFRRNLTSQNPKQAEAELKSKQDELAKITNNLQSATCGLEHIFREMAQIYEAHKSLDKPPNAEQTDWSKYPELAAELMISGHPMELMDGDAGHVPLTWISSLIDEVIHKLGDKRVFVLSVLGIQSSGKSTMLNTMFGLQFAVSAGRCTRGAFMQLIKLSEEMKKDFKWDYILVVDTEGLRALELDGNATFHHDNELATFVVGLGNMTLVNIFGENPNEMQDILQIVVQAFMRMKKVNLSPSCVFVHQNVSDVSASEKNMDGKRKLQEKLDKMAQLAAKEEDYDANSFSDIIVFDVLKDVKYFAQLWEGTPPMAPPNPGYSESVQDLRKLILSKASESPGVTLSTFRSKVHDLWNALLNEKFVFSFKNTLEIAVYRKLEAEYGNWTWALREEMLKIEEQLYPQIINGTLDQVDKSLLDDKAMSAYFDSEKDKEILVQWRGQHELKIKDFLEELVQGLQRKLMKIIKYREANSEFEQTKAAFEKKLLQKSKELADQLRGKPQNDQNLGKQFDRVWKGWVSDLTQGIKPADRINLTEDLIQAINECGFEREFIVLQKKSGEYKKIAQCGDYTKYFRQRNEGLWKRITNFGRVSQEYQEQIKNLIANVQKDAFVQIKSKPLTTRGYNPSYLREMSRNVKTSVGQYESQMKASFTKEFHVNLILYVFDTIEKSIEDSHYQFIKNNDVHLYLESKKNEYNNIFKSFYKGSSSSMILAEMICNKLKDSVPEHAINQTAIDIAGELRCNVPAFKENRLNLEKHVLKSLAEKRDFEKYIEYIRNPRSYTETFIREEVETLLDTEYKEKCKSIFKKNIKRVSEIIDDALQTATCETQNENGNISMWLQEFADLVKDILTFGIISDENFIDINNFDILHDEIQKRKNSVFTDLEHLSVDELKESRQRPDQILIDQLCDCCWEKCPFCAAVCTNTFKDHKESGIDHTVPFHRSSSIRGWHTRGTVQMSLPFCTTNVAGDRSFYLAASDRSVPYKTYREAGPPYDSWSITPDLFQMSYW